MGRIAELFVALAAISTIATFFGFRALARKMVRSLGRKPEEGRPREYRTESGRVLSDRDIEALSDEAERGYDVDPTERRTR